MFWILGPWLLPSQGMWQCGNACEVLDNLLVVVDKAWGLLKFILCSWDWSFAHPLHHYWIHLHFLLTHTTSSRYSTLSILDLHFSGFRYRLCLHRMDRTCLCVLPDFLKGSYCHPCRQWYVLCWLVHRICCSSLSGRLQGNLSCQRTLQVVQTIHSWWQRLHCAHLLPWHAHCYIPISCQVLWRCMYGVVCAPLLRSGEVGYFLTVMVFSFQQSCTSLKLPSFFFMKKRGMQLVILMVWSSSIIGFLPETHQDVSVCPSWRGRPCLQTVLHLDLVQWHVSNAVVLGVCQIHLS